MTIPFNDEFTDTNGVALPSHTPTSGTAWTATVDGADGFEIQSNQCSFLNGGGAGSGYSLTTCDNQGSADNKITARMGFLAAQANVVVATRATDNDNWMGWRYAGTGAAGGQMCIEEAASLSTPVTWQGAVNEWLQFEANGTSGQMRRGGTGGTPSWSDEGAAQTIGNTSETKQGLMALSGAATGTFIIDSFTAEPLATGTINTVDHTDGMFLNDFIGKELELLSLDSVQMDDLRQSVGEKTITDFLLIDDSRVTEIDKIIIDNVMFVDEVLKIFEHLSITHLFLDDSVTTEITSAGALEILITDSLLMLDSVSRIQESTQLDSLLLGDDTFRDQLKELLDRIVLSETENKEISLTIVDAMLFSELTGLLREMLLVDNLALYDSVTTQRITTAVAALVYAKLTAVDLLGISISANDNLLGVTVGDQYEGGF